MQMIIDIPEKVNNRIRSYLGHGYCIRDEDVKIIAEAVYNGQSNTSNTLNALDCISRQGAIDAVCEHGTDLERRGITVLSVANHKQVMVDVLENLPSVQPKEKDNDRL